MPAPTRRLALSTFALPTFALPTFAVLTFAAVACAPAAPPAASPTIAADSGTAATAATPAPIGRPLAPLVGQPLLLFPVQAVRGVSGVEPALLDAEIAFALEERRASRAWTGPDALRRLARASAAYASDPAALALPIAPLRTGVDVRDPLASQLRALAALTDARVVVVPTSLAVAADGAALGVAIIDVRGARVVWAGATAPAPLEPAAGLATRVAERFAELAAPPAQD